MTFTVEFEDDHSRIVTLDQSNRFEDVEMYLEADSSVYIRQFSEELNEWQLLILSYQQLIDLFGSLQSTEGMHETIVENVS
jgi:hypothetical protein